MRSKTVEKKCAKSRSNSFVLPSKRKGERNKSYIAPYAYIGLLGCSGIDNMPIGSLSAKSANAME